MNIYHVYDVFSEGLCESWKHQLFQGALFVLFGIVIVLMPQILVAIVAVFFVLIGLFFIRSALAMRQLRKKYNGFGLGRSDLF